MRDDKVIPTWSGLLWSRFHDMSVIKAEELLFEAADELDEALLVERGEGIGLFPEPEAILGNLCAIIEQTIGYGISRGWNMDGAIEAFIKGDREMGKYL